MPQITIHNDVKHQRNSLQNDAFNQGIQEELILNETTLQHIGEMEVQVAEGSIIEENEQRNYMRTNEQSSTFESDREQVGEIDNLTGNEEYEQARGIDAENQVLNEITQIRNWAITNNIQQNELDKLLGILRTRLLPELVKSAKTFLQTQTAIFRK